HIGDVVRELEPAKRAHYGPENIAELYEDQKRIALVRSVQNISLFLQYRANEVTRQGDTITAVIAQHTVSGRKLRFIGKYFADCTGDGCIGYLAGANYDMTLKGHLGRSNLWNVIDTKKPAPFPRCPWALDLSNKPFPGRAGQGGINKLGGWYWESGFDHDPIEKSEYIRDWNLRAMYGAWDCLKNVDKLYPNHKLIWAAYIAGKRESRRLLGDIILQKKDLLTNKKYPDGLVPATWKIDLHLPDKRYEKGFEGDGFISEAHYTGYQKPYWVPYRCFYSRNVPNLFMAGRDISVTHEALGAVRVMRTCGMMGEVVGMAASLCKKHNTNPRGVYQHHLAELKELAKRGVDKPGVADDEAFKQAAENGRLANEGFIRCRNFVKGWLAQADPTTGLIPRNLSRNKDIWNAQDSAADNYPFMVLTAAITDRPLFEGRMLDMLRTETKLTSRIGNLPDTYSFSKRNFQDAKPDIGRIIFGSSEYIKDGLLPLTEWLGPSPWCERMLGILDDIWKHALVETKYGKIPSTSQEINGEMLQTLSRIYWMTGEKKYLDRAVRLGDYYLLGEHHPTKNTNRLSLDD
ncbi:MAG: FAD-dependent oxidoreductase, partial [Phycisphaerales bacterium]